MKSPSGSFLGAFYLSRFCQVHRCDFFSFRDSFLIFIYQSHFSDNLWHLILSLTSQSRFRYPILNFICQIPFHLMFISWSPFSVSSQTLDRIWLNPKTAYIKFTPPSVLHTSVYLCPTSHQDSSAVRPCSIDGLEINVRPSLSLRLQLADDRFFFVSNSQQLSLAGTQHCGQMTIPIYGMLGVYWEYREYIL